MRLSTRLIVQHSHWKMLSHSPEGKNNIDSVRRVGGIVSDTLRLDPGQKVARAAKHLATS